MNIAIEFDARQLRRAIERAPEKVLGGLNDWVAKTTMRAEREVKLELTDKVDTGQLQSSVKSKIGHLKGEVRPVARHAINVEMGRRPGAKLPPFGEGTSLASWARRHSIPAFVVARSIARKGVKPFPFMERAHKTVKPVAERDGRATLNDIVRSI